MPKLIALAVAGRCDDAKRHVGHMLPRGADLSGLRAQIADACAPEFVQPIMAALPWLADASFNPRSAAESAPPRDVRALLDEAKGHGIARADVSAEELASLGADAVEFDQPTGGRPRKMVRLRIHDPRFNPYAMPI
jgi:hypothetical protein